MDGATQISLQKLRAKVHWAARETNVAVIGCRVAPCASRALWHYELYSHMALYAEIHIRHRALALEALLLLLSLALADSDSHLPFAFYLYLFLNIDNGLVGLV